MKNGLLWGLVLLVAIGTYGMGCQGGNDDGSPSGPTGGSGSEDLSCTVGSDAWTASDAMTATNTSLAPQNYTIFGAGPLGTSTCQIAMTVVDAEVGTYPFAVPSAEAVAQLTLSPEGETYLTSVGAGTGSITISSLTATNIAGTFSFVCKEVTSGELLSCTSGSFNLPITTIEL